MFELSVAFFSSELDAGQDGLEARETTSTKVGLRVVTVCSSCRASDRGLIE